LQLQALQIDISVALGLNEALFKLEVTTVESGSQVVCFEDDSVIANIVVEVD